MLERLSAREESYLLINSVSGIKRIALDYILYAERMERAVLYHCADGQILKSRTLRGSFQEGLAPLLKHKQFYLCGSSFLFNLDHITAVEKDRALLDCNLTAPVPRTLASELRSAWIKYWIGEEEL